MKAFSRPGVCLSLAVALPLLLLACGKEDGAVDGVSLATVGPTGGSVTLSDGTALVLPAGAVGASTLQVSLRRVAQGAPEPPPYATRLSAGPVEVESGGRSLSSPATLSLPYDPSRLPAGVPEHDIVAGYYDEQQRTWIPVQGVVDTDRDLITVQATHFSVWDSWTFDWSAFANSIVNALKLDFFEILEPFQVREGCLNSPSLVFVDESGANEFLAGCVEMDDSLNPQVRVVNRRTFIVDIEPIPAGASPDFQSVEIMESSQRKSFGIRYGAIEYGEPYVARARINVVWTVADTLTDLLLKVPGVDDSLAGDLRLALVGCLNGNHRFKLALDRLLEGNTSAFRDEALQALGDSELLDCIGQLVAGLTTSILGTAAKALVLKFGVAAAGIQLVDAVGTLWNQTGQILFLSNRPAPTQTPEPQPGSAWIAYEERFTAALFDQINLLRGRDSLDGRPRRFFISNSVLQQIAREAAAVAILVPGVETSGWRQPSAAEVQQKASQLGYPGAVTMFSWGYAVAEQPDPLEFIQNAFPEELYVTILRNSAIFDLGLACYTTSPTPIPGYENFAQPLFCVGVAGGGYR